MADRLRHHNLNGAVISVDTWLGSAEHWYESGMFHSLRFDAGFPTLFRTFAANVIDRDLTSYVVPLPTDSLNAAALMRHYEIRPSVVHIDGGHDYNSVIADLRTWWPILAVGGALIGDDYHPVADVWPEVRAAFHEFFKSDQLENVQGKCIIKKLAE